MLISAVMPIMSVYRLPLGQIAYSGHVINLPQDVMSFANTLPRLPSQLDVIVVRKVANQSHRDFRARRSKVHSALQWLIHNNIYYQANRIQIDMDAIAQLPEDGHLQNLHTVIPTADDQLEPPAAEDDDSSELDLSRSFVPLTTQSMTEQEAIQHSIEQRQSNHSSTPSFIGWPSTGITPINEFTTEGYFSCAFPTLFPTGAADFLGQRQNRITIGCYFKHLMMFDDGRFARHPRFRFFALNTEMRRRALQAGQLYVR